MPAPVAAAGITAGAGLLGGALGGGQGQAQAAIPPDLAGTRANQIALLNYLLGFGGAPGSGGAPSRTPGQAPSNPFAGNPGAPGGIGAPGAGNSGPSRGGAAGTGLPSFGDPTKRLEGFFGPLTSPLQQQATTAASDYLKGGLPQQKALEFINQTLAHNPGQGVLDALQPHFQNNLAAANQTGNRFSSGNAVLRSNAVNDYNLLGANALQQGVNQQLQAASTADLLGKGILDSYTQASQLGDTETQRRLQILLQLLNTAQGASFQLPINQPQGNFVSNGLGAAGQVAAILQALGKTGGGIPSAPAFPAGAATYPGG